MGTCARYSLLILLLLAGAAGAGYRAGSSLSTPGGNARLQTAPRQPAARAAAPTITVYSAGITPGSHPQGIAVGPDGNLWFTEPGADRIGKITTGGVVSEFRAGITPGSQPEEIVAGPDGNLWFTEPGADRIGKITTAGVVTEYRVGTPGSSPSNPDGPNWIAAGPDGKLWFTERRPAGRIWKITTGGVVTEYSAGITPGSYPEGIAAGPDGKLWFVEDGADRIGKITTAGVVTEYRAGITRNSGPSGITAGPDGNLWFTEPGADRIGKITTAGVVTEYSAGHTPDYSPGGIAAGPDGNLWFTKPGADRIGKITTAGVVAEYSAGITPYSAPEGIVAGPDGNVWFTEAGSNRIGRVVLHATAKNTPVDCATAKSLARAAVRPVWFPAPPPAGRFVLNAYVPIFGPGLKWTSGQRYVFLGRVPGGANLGEPFPTNVSDPYLANFHRKLQVMRLAKVEGGRLYADWQTSGGNRADLTYAVTKGETLSQFVAFLGSLRRIAWPECRA